MFSALLKLCLSNANDVTSKRYYTSVISFLLHDFIALLFRVLCDKQLSGKLQNNELHCNKFYTKLPNLHF